MKIKNHILFYSTLLLASPNFSFADSLPFELGGHVRLNYSYVDWAQNELRDGLEFESFKLNVAGKDDAFSYKAEYRWYENVDFNTIRFADLTYQIDNHWKTTVGITKVPFGLMPFASNNFWFSINYYIGFEDDYDAGAVVEYERGDWQFQTAYFLNDEYNDAAKLSRYSFDVADDGMFRNKEQNQFNVRANYTAKLLARSTTDIGFSVQQGEILNLDTLQNGDTSAYAFHVRHNQRPFKFEFQYTDFDYDLKAPIGQPTDRLAMSAYDFPFLATSKGKSYIANVVYTLPMKSKQLTPIKCYSEYGKVEPDEASALASSQWVNGCSFGWSKLYVYIDSIHGKNMWFSGGPGVGLDLGGRQETTHRLNISLGIYF